MYQTALRIVCVFGSDSPSINTDIIEIISLFISVGESVAGAAYRIELSTWREASISSLARGTTKPFG